MKKKIKIAVNDHQESDWLFLYFCQLLRQKYDVELSSSPDLWFCYEIMMPKMLAMKFVKYNCIRVCYTGENIKLPTNITDYRFSYEDTDDRNFCLPCFVKYFEFQELRTQMYGDEVKGYRSWPKSRFCNFLSSNANANERIDFCKKLMSYKTVDCPGKVLRNMPPIKDNSTHVNKLNFIKQHKFTIAFENSSSPNYVTEKIFHPLLVNSIPIYWGSPRIAEYFNPEAFINCHDYDNFDQVIERVIEVDNNDDLYRKYVNAPPILESSKTYAMTEEAVMERLDKIVDSIGVITPVCRTMPYQRLFVKAHFKSVSMRLKKIAASVCTKRSMKLTGLR